MSNFRQRTKVMKITQTNQKVVVQGKVCVDTCTMYIQVCKCKHRFGVSKYVYYTTNLPYMDIHVSVESYSPRTKY